MKLNVSSEFVSFSNNNKGENTSGEMLAYNDDSISNNKVENVSDVISSFNGDYEFLSNSYPLTLVYNNREYVSVEHFYQYAKYAKNRGKSVSLKKHWDVHRNRVMQQALKKKFTDSMMRDLLIKTGNKELVNQNHKHDRFWGVCVCVKHHGSGTNMLGKILMKIRDDIKCEDERREKRLVKLYSNGNNKTWGPHMLFPDFYTQ